MGGQYVTEALGIEMAGAFLEHNLCDGYEYRENFYEPYKHAYDELEAFDYDDKYKKNGFKVKRLGEV